MDRGEIGLHYWRKGKLKSQTLKKIRTQARQTLCAGSTQVRVLVMSRARVMGHARPGPPILMASATVPSPLNHHPVRCARRPHHRSRQPPCRCRRLRLPLVGPVLTSPPLSVSAGSRKPKGPRGAQQVSLSKLLLITHPHHQQRLRMGTVPSRTNRSPRSLSRIMPYILPLLDRPVSSTRI